MTSTEAEALCKELHAVADQVVGRNYKCESEHPTAQLDVERSLIIKQQELKEIVKAAIIEVMGTVAQQEVYDRKEAAAFLRVKVSTLDSLAKRGLIHPNIATRKPLYGREELRRFLQDNTTRLD